MTAYKPGSQGFPSSSTQYIDNELNNIATALNQLTNGLTYVQADAGVPSFTPPAITGRVPLFYDTTGNRLYAYSGGSWHAT